MKWLQTTTGKVAVIATIAAIVSVVNFTNILIHKDQKINQLEAEKKELEHRLHEIKSAKVHGDHDFEKEVQALQLENMKLAADHKRSVMELAEAQGAIQLKEDFETYGPLLMEMKRLNQETPWDKWDRTAMKHLILAYLSNTGTRGKDYEYLGEDVTEIMDRVHFQEPLSTVFLLSYFGVSDGYVAESASDLIYKRFMTRPSETAMALFLTHKDQHGSNMELMNHIYIRGDGQEEINQILDRFDQQPDLLTKEYLQYIEQEKMKVADYLHEMIAPEN